MEPSYQSDKEHMYHQGHFIESQCYINYKSPYYAKMLKNQNFSNNALEVDKLIRMKAKFEKNKELINSFSSLKKEKILRKADEEILAIDCRISLLKLRLKQASGLESNEALNQSVKAQFYINYCSVDSDSLIDHADNDINIGSEIAFLNKIKLKLEEYKKLLPKDEKNGLLEKAEKEIESINKRIGMFYFPQEVVDHPAFYKYPRKKFDQITQCLSSYGTVYQLRPISEIYIYADGMTKDFWIDILPNSSKGSKEVFSIKIRCHNKTGQYLELDENEKVVGVYESLKDTISCVIKEKDLIPVNELTDFLFMESIPKEVIEHPAFFKESRQLADVDFIFAKCGIMLNEMRKKLKKFQKPTAVYLLKPSSGKSTENLKNFTIQLIKSDTEQLHNVRLTYEVKTKEWWFDEKSVFKSLDELICAVIGPNYEKKSLYEMEEGL